MIKYFLPILFVTVISTASFGQTTNQKLDQVKNDPKTIENAAKADAGLINKRNITDSVSVKNTPAKRKEAGCKFKRKNKPVHKSL
jgi:hypothetical protein